MLNAQFSPPLQPEQILNYRKMIQNEHLIASDQTNLL